MAPVTRHICNTMMESIDENYVGKPRWQQQTYCKSFYPLGQKTLLNDDCIWFLEMGHLFIALQLIPNQLLAQCIHPYLAFGQPTNTLY